MAGERKLEAAAHRGAVERRDPRLAAGLDAAEDQRELAALLEQPRVRRLLALRLYQLGEGAADFSSMVRSAPPQNVSLPEVMTAPLMAASVATFSTIAASSSITFAVDDVHRAAGHVPGDERDAVGVDVEGEIVKAICAPSSPVAARQRAANHLGTARRPCACSVTPVLVADRPADRHRDIRRARASSACRFREDRVAVGFVDEVMAVRDVRP